MSKLFSIYQREKINNPQKILLFKSGIFYLALDKDALFLSSTLGLKLTNLNKKIKKCGFPISSSGKYFNLIKVFAPFKIIDAENYKSYSITDYKMEEKTLNLLTDLSKIDSDNISVIEAYGLLEKFKNNAINILYEEDNR